MKLTKTIKPAQWMIASQTQAVMSALNTTDQNALFVGGCVRNELLGKPVEDIDIATTHTPEQAQEILQDKGIKTIPTGIDHGTITAVINKKSFEITTLRKDVETDGRHAIIAFTDDWVIDAARRDFTMNTLLADSEGNIYDPLEKGMTDLERGAVIFVGDPAQRIQEDYLRILRFFRFHALYGVGDPDPQALKACKKYALKISELSRERITQEFFKIILTESPVSMFDLMIRANVLEGVFDLGYQSDFMTHLSVFQNRYGLAALGSRLLVLLGLNLENRSTLEKHVIIPKVFQKDMNAIFQILALPDLDSDHAVKVATYKYGRTNTAQALMIELAQDRVMNGYAPKALEIVQNWDIPNFPVNGNDLIAQGYRSGPELGEALNKLEDEWIKNNFKDKDVIKP